MYYLIDMSGAYREQDFWKQKETKEGCSDAQLIDCRDIDGSLYFCSDEAAGEIRKRIALVPERALHFIDSGDYHYISLFFMERIRTPFSLLLLDHHSDCMESAFGGGLLTCGSWVLRSLETLPMLRQVIMVGPADEDCMKDRLKDSRVLWIDEEEICGAKNTDTHKKLKEWLDRCPVYVSLDKDVMCPEDAVTNWSQGKMGLNEVISVIEMAKTGIIGMDVCGEQRCSKEGFSDDAGAGAAINNRTNGIIVHTMQGRIDGLNIPDSNGSARL